MSTFLSFKKVFNMNQYGFEFLSALRLSISQFKRFCRDFQFLNLLIIRNVQKQPVFCKAPEVFCKAPVKAPVLESLLNKVQGPQACHFTKKRLEHRCFPVKFAKFLRTPILKNSCELLLFSMFLQRTLYVIFS